MKLVTITLVEEPASFEKVKFTTKDYAAAKKVGDLRVPHGTAMENIRNSKGMYRIKPEPDAVKEIEFKGLKDPADMTSSELAAEMTAHGKAPKKQIKRSVAVKFVRDLREKAAALIVDDEE